MQLEVYQTDAEAYEAAAEIAAGHLVAAAATGAATLALGGGRGARAVQLALAARGEIAWARVTCCFTDERCTTADDAHANLKVARDSLFAPRGVAADRILAVPVGAGDAVAIAAAYATTLASLGTPPVFDVLLLDLADDGSIAALASGSPAIHAETTVAAVPNAVPPRITITPVVLRAARHIVLTATGDERAVAVAAALREPVDIDRRPAQLVLPSPTVTWVVDRAAAAALLRDARPAQ
ncbi:MAG TPA: 6-phosphogluconolactonase [Candidatus Binatia bacterium]|jgi:6-phosphogluconolactonase/glucosamine-6-phosphate isomerase/deaminase|nr:6-phosphogluconolactonase [Candidatus Binatia bacterium]